MRRLLLFLSAVSVASAVLPATQAYAQQTRREREEEQRSKAEKEKAEKEKQRKKDQKAPAPLQPRLASGPCPYVKVLYDAGRDVEFKDDKESLSQVAYTGEIDGVSSDCAYKGDEPIQVAMNVLFALGRGPQAESAEKNYRYWIAVTDRNRSVINKEYFDLKVRFPEGKDRVYATEIIKDIQIPRASASVAGNNFEILVGFDVTPKQAEFNVEGKRFHINAVSSADASAAPKQ
jgi:hypothetical protein